MRNLANMLTRLLADRRGATAIEYALIASLISVAAIMSFVTMGGEVTKKYDAVDAAVGGAV